MSRPRPARRPARAPSPARRSAAGPAARRRVPEAPATGARAAVERRSAVLLVLLSQAPRFVLPLASVVLLTGGVLLPRLPALVCFAVLLALVGWLSYLSWPVTEGRGRVLRVVALAMLAVLAVQSTA